MTLWAGMGVVVILVGMWRFGLGVLAWYLLLDKTRKLSVGILLCAIPESLVSGSYSVRTNPLVEKWSIWSNNKSRLLQEHESRGWRTWTICWTVFGFTNPLVVAPSIVPSVFWACLRRSSMFIFVFQILLCLIWKLLTPSAWSECSLTECPDQSKRRWAERDQGRIRGFHLNCDT